MLDSIISALNHSTEHPQSFSKRFYVEDVLDFSDLNINIAEIGPIQFPIEIPDIESLLNVSESAKFGFREQTLLDKAVRDTSEISSDKLSVQINQKKLNRMLDDMREQLGLAEDTILRPHLHNLLIYGPGQFFKPHQDSEKLDGMVATLVIILPSPHIGGDLIVQHKQHNACFESESIKPQSLKCAAFYADCQHEVKLVKQGYRIALTYNLVLESKSDHKMLTSQKHHNLELMEIQGWMGNYGNTADYWYRRAAIILWRQEDQIVFNFKLNAEQALMQLTQLTECRGNEEQAKAILKRIHSLLKSHHYESKKEFLNLLTKLACYISDRDVASILLSKVLFNDFTFDATHNIAQWQETYGVEWCLRQLRQWIEQDRFTEYGHEKKPSLLQDIDKIILNLINLNIDAQIHRLFTQHQIEALTKNDKKTVQEPPSQEAKTISRRITMFNQLLKGCLLQQDYSSHHYLIDYALENPKLYPEEALGEAVFILKNIVTNDHVTESGYTKLKESVKNSLNKELSLGLRSSDDWAIKTQLSCNCERCNIAKAFLQSPNEIDRIWPLAADGREHIARVFNDLELPVDLSIIEGSRPYKLVMKKNARLFTDAQKRFNRLTVLYEKILNI